MVRRLPHDALLFLFQLPKLHAAHRHSLVCALHGPPGNGDRIDRMQRNEAIASYFVQKVSRRILSKIVANHSRPFLSRPFLSFLGVAAEADILIHLGC